MDTDGYQYARRRNQQPVYAANDAGTVVGTYITGTGQTHGFVWTGGTGWTDPGTLGG